MSMGIVIKNKKDLLKRNKLTATLEGVAEGRKAQNRELQTRTKTGKDSDR